MRKFLAFLLLILLTLPSCSSLDSTDVSTKADKSALSKAQGQTQYIANASTKTYHLSSCYLAKDMKAENRYETTDFDFLTERGFKACKKCIDTENS